MTNRYPGTCTSCGNRVEADNGVCTKVEGRWTVQHPADCCPPAVEAPAPRENLGQTCEPGVYVLPDGDAIVKVQANQAKTRVYAKRWIETGERILDSDGVTRVRGDWEYAPGLIATIRPEHRMSLEQAKAFIVRYGRCVRCGRKLKAADSVERGIGPVCVKYFTELAPPARTPASGRVCGRHGNELAPTCWECDVEADVAAADLAEAGAA